MTRDLCDAHEYQIVNNLRSTDTWAMLEALMFDSPTARGDRSTSRPVWLGRADLTVHGPLSPFEALAALAALPATVVSDVQVTTSTRHWIPVTDLPTLIGDPRPALTIDPVTTTHPIDAMTTTLAVTQPTGTLIVSTPAIDPRVFGVENGDIRTEYGIGAWFRGMQTIVRSSLFEASGIVSALYACLETGSKLSELTQKRPIEAFQKALEITIRKNAQEILMSDEGTFAVVSGPAV